MLLILPVALFWLLLRPSLVMASAEAACRLFVRSVLPGLFPYMTLSMMLVSRLSRRMSPGLLMLLGWCGGSPTGARLLSLCPALPMRTRRRLAITCSTMSPMFLWGTLGVWLHAPAAGLTILLSVILGGWITGQLAVIHIRPGEAAACASAPPPTMEPLTLGQAVEQTARTMLLVCGTMVMLRVPADLLAEALPAAAALPLSTLLEVTTGAEAIAALPLPLPWKTALLAGVTGMGGAAIMLQNRAVWEPGFLRLPEQLLWQALHGVLSVLLALGGMELLAGLHLL